MPRQTEPVRSVLRGTRDVERELTRERGRSQGLERGLSALADRVTELRRENEALRARLKRRTPAG